MLPKHYSLKGEGDKDFEIHDSRDGKTFKIAKKDIHPATQIKVMKMQKYSDGGEVEGMDSGIKPWVKDAPDEPSTNSFFGLFPSDEEMYGTKVASAAPIPEVAPAPVVPPVESRVPESPMNVSPVDSAPVPSITPAPQPTASAPVQGGFPSTGQLSNLQTQYEKRAMEEVGARSKQDSEVAELQQMHAWALENHQKSFGESMQAIQSNIDQLSNDIATSKVDPNQYWESKSSGAKVSAMLGVLLGGIGAGLSGSNTNMVWNALQNNIDRDIQSQKDNISKKQNLLADNLRIQGNLMQAEAATRLQMNAVVQGQMAKIAAQTNNPIVAAQVQQKILEMKMKDIPLQQSLAQAQANRKTSQQLNDMMAKGMVTPETRINMIKEDSDRKEAREELQMVNGYKSSVKRIQDTFAEAEKLGAIGTSIPGSNQSAELDKLRATLTSYLRQNMKGQGTITDMDQRLLIDPYLPSRTDLINKNRLKTKMQGMIDSLQTKISSGTPTLDGYGISIDKTAPTTNPMEGKTATGPKGQRIIMKNGKWVPLNG